MSTQPSTTFPEGFWDWDEERLEEWVEKWLSSAWDSRNVPHGTTKTLPTVNL